MAWSVKDALRFTEWEIDECQRRIEDRKRFTEQYRKVIDAADDACARQFFSERIRDAEREIAAYENYRRECEKRAQEIKAQIK